MKKELPAKGKLKSSFVGVYAKNFSLFNENNQKNIESANYSVCVHFSSSVENRNLI